MDICLVTMPFASVERPSMALGALKGALAGTGLETACLYPNLKFAELIGVENYNAYQFIKPEDLVGEWTFAGALFGHCQPEDDYLDWVVGRLLRPTDPENFKTYLSKWRRLAIDFVEETATGILAQRPRIVGCTSTFQQHVASLALLRRIKDRAPGTATMLGGANCEGPMGEATHRNFPWVDYVVSGEADELIADLCRGIVDAAPGEPFDSIQDAVLTPAHRRNRAASDVGRDMVDDMDRLPLPDYDDYFRALDNTGYRERIRPGVPVEASRGCWWGAVRHCTFCGLNGNGMVSRVKSTPRVIHELDAMFERHGIGRFGMVDNILAIEHLRTLLPELALRSEKYSLFFETKANLNRAEVALLADAGVRWIQPGIESLHTEVLKLMDKGLQAWRNVQLLRWCQEFGVRLTWAIIHGFPGERDAWNAEVADWIPLMFHLPPPDGIHPVRFDRFSLYHSRAADWGLELKPTRSYRSVYRLENRELEDLAYYFENSSSAAGQPDGNGVLRLKEQVRGWRSAHSSKPRPELSFADGGGRLSVTDTRPIAVQERREYRGLRRSVLLACEEAPVERTLPGKVSLASGSGSAVADAVAELVSDRLLLRVDGRLVLLATRQPPGKLASKRSFPEGVTLPTRRVRRPGEFFFNMDEVFADAVKQWLATPKDEAR
jgi:ribosomal peptide maturation radical SAM protein 1